MTSGLGFAPKRTRQSASKARTGCIICKHRRVKCDETKPFCRRCTIGGRSCEYNTPRTVSPPRNIVTVYLPPIQAQPTLFAKDRSLDLFHHKLAEKLDGQFTSNFWSRLVLQLSHSEPSIRHAISAVSILYQDIELSLRHPAGYVDANPETQRQWESAMKSLSTRIQEQPGSSLVPLTCCLLFTCAELLRGNIECSLLHVQSGFNILAALRLNGDGSVLGTIIPSNDSTAIEEHLVPMFSSLNVLCSLAGRNTPPIYTLTTRETSSQEDLDHSKQILVELLDTCIRFIGKVSSSAAMLQNDLDNLIEQVELQTRLDAWHDQLHELIERMHTAGRSVNEEALNLLLVHYKVIYIWVRVCTTAGEMASDSYHADFEELVQYAEKFVKSGGGMVAPQPLSFDIQILGPLYYAVLKCRYPATRRRALELLPFAPRREGLWNARYAYVTGKRVIELEERHLNEQGLPIETSRLYGLTLPDDESRVYHMDKMPFDPWKSNYTVIPSPQYPGMLKAEFHTKPWGPLGEWQTLTEYINL